MNDYPHKCESAAQICAGKIQQYLETCASREQWPDHAEVDSIIGKHFAPVLRKTPQPIDGTLLAAFTRFADLSQYWHRNGTPDSLAVSELEERHRLERDIPELIKRNTAFADLVSSRMFDAVAKVHAEPPRDDAGQGWRMLDGEEIVQEGDEYWSETRQLWWPSLNLGLPVNRHDAKYRRRIAKNGASDTAGHIRADFEPNAPETPATAQETASKETWRMLKPNIGEQLQAGDQSGSDRDGWCDVPSEYFGDEVLMTGFRRRVTPPK